MKSQTFKWLFLIGILSFAFSCKPKIIRIFVGKDASRLESLAASEIRRYVYLRTGELPEIVADEQHPTSGKIIVIDRKGGNLVPADLKDEELFLKTFHEGSLEKLIISGGSEQAVLYAAYEFAEQLGVRFYLHGDVVPDEKKPFTIPDLDIRKKPLFSVRGIQPFHDFPEGPDWWNAVDYKAIIGQLPKLKMNFIGFHTYPFKVKFDGSGPKAEPLVWIGKEGEFNDDGVVTRAYPVQHFATNDSTWGYLPVKTSAFISGGSQIFESDTYGADYMKNVSGWPHTEKENIQIINESGKMFCEAFTLARKLGVKTCAGTETPLIIPKEVRTRFGIKAETVDQVKELYKGIFKRIQRTYPLDYYWLWTPEKWTWKGADDAEVAKTEKDMQLAHEVLNEMGKPFQLATCGWVLGPPKDRTQFDRVLPKDMPFSCINRGAGYTPVEKGFQAITDRPKWSIPWMEDDANLIANQLWVGRLRKDALDSYRFGCNGLIGIHWRTRELSPNVAVLAKAAWIADQWESACSPQNRDLPSEDFYVDWVKSEFGSDNQKLVELFVRLDSKGIEQTEGHKGDSPLDASDWVDGPGGLMTNKRVEDLAVLIKQYDFLAELTAMRASISGAGNLERFDYWLNNLKFNKALLETALKVKQLQMAVDDIKKETDPAKRKKMAGENALPIRLELAKKWAEMTGVLLSKISTTGEMGILANLEMHSNNHNQNLTGQDKYMQELGVILPAEAFPSKDYSGKLRVIVTTNQSILSKDEDFYLRVRVLATDINVKGKLLWRTFGKGEFKSVELLKMERNVFEILIPASEITADFEYYLEVSAGNEFVKFPATTPEINRTVVVMNE